MSLPRFFLPPAAWTGPEVTLDRDESHHAITVLRLTPGSRLCVFDGRGREAVATLLDTSGGAARLKIGAPQTSPRLRCEITLAQAIPKGRNMDLIVQKAVELGAARIAPIISDRAVVRLDASEASSKQAKWTQVAIEAAKQCGQNHLPEILPPQHLKSFFSALPKADLMIIGSLQPGAIPLKQLLGGLASPLPKSVIAFIGPEGDFTPAEIGFAIASGCRPVSLGPIILRTETAAIYVLSVLSHELQGDR